MRNYKLLFVALSLCAVVLVACKDESSSPSNTADSGALDSGTLDSGAPVADSGDPSCPDIACLGGAILEADWPFDFEQARGMPITSCRNDECFTGMLAASAAEPEPGSGVGFSVPATEVVDRDQTGSASVSFWGASGGGVYLRLDWQPWADADLHDGDRYRVTADAPGGTRVLIDREVDYGTHEIGTGACRQSCRQIELDLRGDDSDGGTDDDAGQ